MNQKGLTETFMMISNWKNPLVSMISTKKYFSALRVTHGIIIPTCSVPAEAHAFGGWTGGYVEGQETDHKAGEVCEQVSSVRHKGQTVSNDTAWKRTQSSGELFQKYSQIYYPTRRIHLACADLVLDQDH